jgi:hypothetical protein
MGGDNNNSLSTAENQYLADKIYSSLERKQRKFMLKCHRGVACGLAKGYRFRWFTLTESDDAIASGADFSHEFNKFIVWLRYTCPDFQYIVVEHRQGDLKRRNWHILSYGTDKLPVDAMRDYWREHYLSTVTGMEEIRHIDKAVKYLAGYLAKHDKFVRSWQSHGWVFDGWLGMSKRYFKNFFEYPTSDELVLLSKMTKQSRIDTIPTELLSGPSRYKKAKSRASQAHAPGRVGLPMRVSTLDERHLQPNMSL